MARLPDPSIVAALGGAPRPVRRAQPTGIANPLLPEVKAPEPPPVTRIVDLPPAEADGARDEAKRGRRPAPGARRGQDRVGGCLRCARLAPQGGRRAGPAVARGAGPPGGGARGARRTAAGVIRRIATAREHGDLKENAEYHAAREEQGFLEARIKQLEAKLKHAVVVAPTVRGAVVGLGSRVRVEESGEESVLQVVSSAEANSREGRISSVSPVGAALMGRKVGDAVTIITPGGEIRYSVLEIS